MLIDHITTLARKLGVPTDVECRPCVSPACQILERIETLKLIDYCWSTRPQLGERFRRIQS